MNQLSQEVQPRPTLNDYVALWLLKLAKLHRYQLSHPHTDSLQFYEQFFDHKDVDLYVEDPRMRMRREVIRECLQKYVATEAKILDVGCGLGDVLMGIPAGYQLYGMDFAKNNLHIAEKRLNGQAILRQGSIYEIPFETASMDVCLCLEVLEHIEEDNKGIKEIVRVLKPGGILIAAVPYTYYWPEYLKLMGHFRHYTRDSFATLLHTNGLTPENYLANYPNWHQAYTRRYALIRAQAMLFGKLLGRKTIHEFRWPWQRKPAIESLLEQLQTTFDKDVKLDYSQVKTSTFIMARKGGK
jgi:SAM-dependent methyltransferase